MRIATVSLAGILVLAVAGPSWAGKITVQFDAPKQRDSVSLSFVAGDESVVVSVPVGPAVDGAKVKRNALLTAVRTRATAKGYKWSFDTVDPAGFTVFAPADSITATFKPGKTGEAKDIEKGDAEGTITFAADVFDPHDADGDTALFRAGVIVGGTEYVATLMADDPALMDDLSGEAIAAILALRLGGILPSAGVTLGYTPGTDFLTIVTTHEDDGIIFGNTSITDGVIGELTVRTPGPSSLAVVALSSLVLVWWSGRSRAAMLLAVALLSAFSSPAIAGRMGSWDDKAMSLERQLKRVHDKFTDQSLGFFYFASHGKDVDLPAPPSLVVLVSALAVLGICRKRGSTRPPRPSP